ncbi:MAG: hypothetical protein F6K18_08735 [Okeania sp. SIO2C2]|uniref:hypothetical protein n=1 Tax=Okeania sp. SIO2C2 TaxID=2607787 RepID=UPI0013B60F90|nr:hypothetical protein [Okeania sp. SIO2C2]NEP86912.1 hypothetical protein [Okeania sp. SIO2C2]
MTTDIDILKDERVNCYSVMIQLRVAEYLEMVEKVFNDRGGLEGQRDTVKTTTALRIRKRMVEDLKKGAILPPIVVGVITSEDKLSTLKQLDRDDFLNLITNHPENISIIDGMQRTTALYEAQKTTDIRDNKVRIEYWIASQVNSLIYRMLVLNTGQIPWNLRRQIETVFKENLKELNKKYPDIQIIKIDDQKKPINSRQYRADKVIELFLVFGSRKEKVDLQERLADEFTRQDFIESVANPNFTNIFYEVIGCLADFDSALSAYENTTKEVHFKKGKDLFRSHPACIGFVTSIALYVQGRPGNDYSLEKQNKRWRKIKNDANTLFKRVKEMEPSEIGKFLDFPTLNELISKKTGKSTNFERAFFLEAFKVLIDEDFDVQVMTPCWRAY